MNHIKIYEEYSDEEITGLMGDLEKVGHERLKGWYIMTTSAEEGYTSIYAIVAHNESEVESMIRKNWLWANSWLPKRVGEAYQGNRSIYDNFLDALMVNLTSADEIRFYQLVKDLAVKGSAAKKPTIFTFPGYNPVLTYQKLNQIFLDIDAKMASQSEKDEFEEESSEITFPDIK
jgi:hypothetical protein